MKLEDITKLLLVIGGLNWGFVVFGINLVEFIPIDIVQTLIYVAVALSAVIEGYKLIE